MPEQKTKKPKRLYVWVEQKEVISALRKAFRRFPAYKQCLDNAKSEYFIPSKKGKPMRRVQWECAKCKNKLKQKERDVDHIYPVIDPEKGFIGYGEYASRLFCALVNLQVLCKPCHKAKSKLENAIRLNARKEKKA
jgi:5-methylcytosine-specific restriction endonuclease McrA